MSTERRKLFRLPWRTARQIRADVEEEFRFHLDMRVDALAALGVSRDAATGQALREFGDLDEARRFIDAVDRDIETAQRRSEIMHELWQDLRYAVRCLGSAPAFTVAAIATLALGIGANTAIFSVVNAVLLQPIPFPHPDRLVRVVFTQQGHGDAGTPMDMIDYPSQATRFVGFSTIEGTTANLARNGADAERIQGARVSANYFALLGAKPVVGRFFVPGDDRQSAASFAVISEQLWRRDFSGDPSIAGKVVRINSSPFTIIGVVAAAQRYPVTVDVWMTKKFTASELNDQSRYARWLGMLARVQDGSTVAAANAEIARLAEQMEHRFPEAYRERRARIVPVQEFQTGSVRKPLLIMLGAVALVLLIACANVANLMLVRATSREPEMAVRTALGAGRARLVRQLVTESVLLSLAGGAAGLGVAWLGTHELIAQASQALVVVRSASLDGVTLAVTMAVALLTGVVFGTLPAVHATRGDLAIALRAGARGTRARPNAHRTTRIIVASEVGLAVTLLTAAGLLLHSFTKLTAVDPGFRREGVLSMKVSLPQAYDTTAIRAFVRELEDRARATPGVNTVGVSNFIPLDGASFDFNFTIRGRPPLRVSDQPDAQVRQVTPDFFAALGMPIVRGRGIAAGDRPGAVKVLVINRALADRFFPNENAVGQALSIGWGSDSAGEMRQIVGVVGDVHGSALTDEPAPTVYVPMLQVPDHNISIVVRTSAAPAALAAPLRAIVRDLDRELPVFSVLTMQQRVANSIGPERFYATLTAIFAALALLLAAVGLYGVMAYAVSQRTHELGVRVALGATADRISRMVIAEGLALAATGATLGVCVSLAAGRLLATLLFGVDARDPVTIIGVVALLIVVAAIASWLPARRAARADPLVAMRGD